jgi:hypothetical protein
MAASNDGNDLDLSSDQLPGPIEAQRGDGTVSVSGWYRAPDSDGYCTLYLDESGSTCLRLQRDSIRERIKHTGSGPPTTLVLNKDADVEVVRTETKSIAASFLTGTLTDKLPGLFKRGPRGVAQCECEAHGHGGCPCGGTHGWHGGCGCGGSCGPVVVCCSGGGSGGGAGGWVETGLASCPLTGIASCPTTGIASCPTTGIGSCPQ